MATSGSSQGDGGQTLAFAILGGVIGGMAVITSILIISIQVIKSAKSRNVCIPNDESIYDLPDYRPNMEVNVQRDYQPWLTLVQHHHIEWRTRVYTATHTMCLARCKDSAKPCTQFPQWMTIHRWRQCQLRPLATYLCI